MAAPDLSSATDQVFDHLSQGIASGRWKPGDKLPSEAELCRQLGASRVTVRSAISRLTGLGQTGGTGNLTQTLETGTQFHIPFLPFHIRSDAEAPEPSGL